MEKIAIIGIGKMGLCFALNLERAGYEVLGIDINPGYVQQINDKLLSSHEPGVENLLLGSIHFRAATQMEELITFQPSLIFIMVPTPDSPVNGYDHSFLNSVIAALLQPLFYTLRTDMVVACTTLPGYCDGKLPELTGRFLTISYSPQFIAQGSIVENQQNPDQVLIGEANATVGNKIEAVYKRLCCNTPEIHKMSVLSAEITKLATNCFLTMKIAFANSIGDLASLQGAQTDKILNAIGADSRIGKKFLHYGFGYGGPCLPRDNRALACIAKQKGIDLFLSAASDQANKQHLDFQFNKMMAENTADMPVHFYAITYKKESLIIEESQQLALAVLLARAGRKVIIHERKEVVASVNYTYPGLFEFVCC